MQLKRTVLFIILIGMSFITFPTNSEAHPGARDELGGHFQRSDCVYHLHNPTELAKTAKNMNELIQLIKKNNSNSDCSSSLNESKVDLEGFTFTKQEQEKTQESNNNKETLATTKDGENLILGQKYKAKLEKCVDGDTANFIINGVTYKTRFLYIDTPESTNKIEPFGKEASEFTCSFLQDGSITLETDGNTLFDKYDRLLAWVWVDGKLHQEEITKAGLVEDFYDYGDYLYENRIISAMEEAKRSGVGIYANGQKTEPPTESTNSQQESENGSIVTAIIFIIIAVFLTALLKRKKSKRS